METISFPAKVSHALNFVFSIRRPDVCQVLGVEIPEYFVINSFVPTEIKWGDEKKTNFGTQSGPQKRRFVVIISSGKTQEIKLFLTYQEQWNKFLVEAVSFTKNESECQKKTTGEQQLAYFF